MNLACSSEITPSVWALSLFVASELGLKSLSVSLLWGTGLEVCLPAILMKSPKIGENQLLQLCTDRTAWSDSVTRSASVRFGN